MAQVKENASEIDLEKIAGMSREEISNLRKQTIALQQKLDEKRQDLREGNFEGGNKREKKKSYDKLKEEIDILVETIESNQQVLELYVQAKVERGDFKQLGIKNMEDFVKASQASNDQAIKIEEKVLERAEGAQKKVKEAESLKEINELIAKRNEIEEQVKNTAKEIEEIKKQIEENENKINALIKKLGSAKEEEKDSIDKEIQELENENSKLEQNKKTLVSKNAFNISIIRGIDLELQQKGIEKTDTQSLKKVYEKNETSIQKNIEEVQKFLEKNNIDYSNMTISEAIDKQIEYRKGRIEEFNLRKEEMARVGERIKEQHQARNSQQQNGASQQQRRAPQQQNGAPQQQSGAPQQQSGAPQQQSGAPQQQSGAPQQQSGTPQQQSGTPQQQSGTPQQTDNHPTVIKGESLFTKAKNKVTEFIDRYNPKLKQQRIEFIKALHPDLDNQAIAIIANDKEKIGELNDLIRKGVTPQEYAKSQTDVELSDKTDINGNVISQEASEFIKMLELQAEYTNPEKGHSEAEIAYVDKYISNIREQVEGSDDRDGI